MALTAGRWFVSYELVESSGKSVRRTYELNSPADYDAAVVSEAAFRLDLAGVTDMVIKSYRIYQEYYEAALVLPADVEKEDEAMFLVALSNPLKTPGRILVPAPKIGLFVSSTGPGRNEIDPTDSAVTDFVSNFLSGGTNLMLLSDGEEGASFLSGHRLSKGTPRS